MKTIKVKQLSLGTSRMQSTRKHKAEVELGEIKRFKLGVEGILDSMFQRPKSEQCQKLQMKFEAGNCKLVAFVLRVRKRCWANTKHSVVTRDSNGVEVMLHIFCWPKQNEKVEDGTINRPNTLTWVAVVRTKF